MTDITRKAFEATYSGGSMGVVAYAYFKAGWQAATLAEQERCAKVCDGLSEKAYQDYEKNVLPGMRYDPHTDGVSDGAGACADAIRRGGDA